MKLANWRLPLASVTGLLGAVCLLVPQAASASAAPVGHGRAVQLRSLTAPSGPPWGKQQA